MISFATIPRPFTGDCAVRQHNAIASWAAVSGAEVFLLGDEEGVSEAAKRHGARHLRGLPVEAGAPPRFDHAFALLADSVSTPWICFINADIVLSGPVATLARRLDPSRHFAAGRRTNVDLPDGLAADPARTALLRRAAQAGERGPANAIDWFLFARDERLLTWPSFYVGRGASDNWFLRRAVECGYRIVDASASVLALHQRHDYGHVGGGGFWTSPESRHNYELLGPGRAWDLYDADRIYWRGLLLPALGCRQLRRRWQRRNEGPRP